MVKINMDMIQTIGLAVVLLLIGIRLRKKINFFEKYCIPAPVIGGFLFSIIVFIFRQTNVAQIKFDDTLQKFFMVMFFTSVGFNASLKVLKKGGQMVYATCSILPSENGEQVQKFLLNNPEYHLIREESIMPSEGYDGFYMALIEKK